MLIFTPPLPLPSIPMAALPPQAGDGSPYVSYALTSLTVTDSGAKLLVENDEEAKYVEFDLVFSSAGEAKEGALGGRHLMEHLVGYGKEGSLDDRIEADGGWLELQTLRDGISIRLYMPPASWKKGFAYLQEIITAEDQWTDANLAAEKSMIAKESDLTAPSYRLSSAAWSAIYKDQAPDPLGNLKLMAGVTVADLKALAKRTFCAARAALVIDGPLDLDTMKMPGLAFLQPLPAGQAVDFGPRAAAPGGANASAETTGSARACPIGSLASPDGMATLAAGLAVASQCHDAFVDYQPSLRPGVLTVGSTVPGEVEHEIDSLDAEDPARLYALGFNLAKRFLDLRLKGPDHCMWEAILLSQSRLARPPLFTKVLAQVDLPRFQAALAKLAAKNAVEVSGE